MGRGEVRGQRANCAPHGGKEASVGACMGRGEAKVNGQQVEGLALMLDVSSPPGHCHACPHARTTSSLANCFLEKTWLVQRSSHGQKPCGMKAEAATSLFQPLDGCGYGPRTGRNPGVADSMAGAGPAPRYPRQRQMLVLAEEHTAMHAPNDMHRHALIHWKALPCTRPSAYATMHACTGSIRRRASC